MTSSNQNLKLVTADEDITSQAAFLRFVNQLDPCVQ